jgi:hypothetical protein
MPRGVLEQFGFDADAYAYAKQLSNAGRIAQAGEAAEADL